jgi:hypothetical protein
MQERHSTHTGQEETGQEERDAAPASLPRHNMTAMPSVKIPSPLCSNLT